MSKLIVEICKIAEVETHPNADKLDIVTVKGWKCIVGRGQYKVGDLVIYCPPDSVIPSTLVEQFKLAFLKKNGKVGSIKLRGEFSQGLILDLVALAGCQGVYAREGVDVAEALGITKYEVPEPEFALKVAGKKRSAKLNQFFDKYTDIENINNFCFALPAGTEVVITEKIHGCNARYGNLPVNCNTLWGKLLSLFGQRYEFVYGSRTVQKKMSNIHHGFYSEDVWGKIGARYNMSSWLPKDYIIYGEIYGKGIQDLVYGLTDIEFRVFDVKYKGRYLNFDEFYTFFRDVLEPHGIKMVPLLFVGPYCEEVKKLYTQRNSELAKDQLSEGCVIKPVVERETRGFGRVIVKSINPEYLTRRGGSEFH